jgi:hypothetical protein
MFSPAKAFQWMREGGVQGQIIGGMASQAEVHEWLSLGQL